MKSKCSQCHKDFQRGKYSSETGWICEDCLGYKVKQDYEWVPDRIKQERRDYARDLIQPYRQGEFSKDFKDAYPDKAKGMVESGTISKKAYKQAKEVWR